MKNKIIISGIQPTGNLHIGHYITILSKIKNLQYNNKFIILIADLHSMTNSKNIKNIKNNIFDILSLILAIGIDHNKNIIFLQSQIPEHTNLFWLLLTNSKFNYLKNMHKCKNKILNNYNFNLGLFTYPILMASDILLYNVDYILVGKDQMQHLELVIKLSKKINYICNNNLFDISKKNIFKNLDYNIMSLNNPNIKMSKSSNNKNSYISLLDNFKNIKYKIKRSVTDSDINAIIKYDFLNKPGISNLLNIVSNLNNINIKKLENIFENKNYSYFKKYVYCTIFDKIYYISKNYNYIRKNEDYLNNILYNGYLKIKNISKENFYNIKKGLYKYFY